MSVSRRQLMKYIAAVTSALAILPTSLMAAWPKLAFTATTQQQVITELFGEQAIEQSEEIHIKLDKRVESGHNVPIEVSTTLSEVESITLLLSHNPHPLAANIRFSEGSVPFIATRLKLSQDSEVTAIVKTVNGLYQHQQRIRVLVSGCHT